MNFPKIQGVNFKSIQVVNLRPGDILVATLDDEPPIAVIKQIEKMLRKVIPDDVEVLIVNGVTLSVIRKEDAAERNAQRVQETQRWLGDRQNLHT